MARFRNSLAHRFSLTMCLLGGLLLASPGVQAGGLEVSPTTLQITSQQTADGITLSNVGDTPLHAQVRVFAWSQKDNEDLLAPSTGIAVSPPMLQIAPGAKQLLRVIRSSTAPTSGAEQTYRLIIDEIPAAVATPKIANAPPAAAGNAGKASATTALNFYMRYSLPVFVGDAGENAVPPLSWRVDKSSRQWTITASNTGSFRAQVADVEAVLADQSRQTLLSGLVGYVLAGQTRHWTFNAPANADKVTGFEAMINRKVQLLDVSSSP